MTATRIAVVLLGAILSGVAAGIISARYFRWGANWQRYVTAALLGMLLAHLFGALAIRWEP